MPGTRIAAGWGTTRMKLERHYCKSLAFEVYLSAICQQVFKPDAAAQIKVTDSAQQRVPSPLQLCTF